MGGCRAAGGAGSTNPDFTAGDKLVLFFSLINGICRLLGYLCELNYSLYGTKGIQMHPNCGSHPCQRPFGTPLCCRLQPTQFLPSFTDVILCVASCCGASHEALNEGFLSVVGGFARRGSNGTDAEQLTAQASEAFQVTLGYCLLMDFSVRRGPGCGERPIRGPRVHVCFSFACLYV